MAAHSLQKPLEDLWEQRDSLSSATRGEARDAVEAALEPGRSTAQPAAIHPNNDDGAVAPAEDPLVVIRWDASEKDVVLAIEDNGSGLLNPSNAFIPFYTTKPAGSGIGLALSRQIVEAHGGSIELLNRAERGCQAKVTLPRFLGEGQPDLKPGS